MADFEVPEPILNSPYEEPAEHWSIEEGASPERRPERHPAGYFYRDPKAPRSDSEHDARGTCQELKLVNLIRERVKHGRSQGYVPRTIEASARTAPA
jgi:type III restriction enzyme